MFLAHITTGCHLQEEAIRENDFKETKSGRTIYFDGTNRLNSDQTNALGYISPNKTNKINSDASSAIDHNNNEDALFLRNLEKKDSSQSRNTQNNTNNSNSNNQVINININSTLVKENPDTKKHFIDYQYHSINSIT